MKRILTYGWLLLTLLASLFVVSACQDDVPTDNTEIMVTFTTRAKSLGETSKAPNNEQMHDLRVIMLRSDGTIVEKDDYIFQDSIPSSVTFTFSTTIPNPSGEDFTFLAIANEEYITGDLPWDKRVVGNQLSQSAIKDLTINTDINTNPIPQTDLWTVHVPQTNNYQVKDTLDFAASKISVVFKNQTEEAQSLSNIRIEGITPNTQGYLFKQDQGNNDYIDSKSQSNTISLGALELDVAKTDSIPYYTYPLAEGNFSTPVLKATWGDEERELDLSAIRSLARNQHLRIEITLTPAGDITVNYTIADWKDNNTYIGNPVLPTPGGNYDLLGWGDANDVVIGGGGKIWDLGNGQKITGEEVADLTKKVDLNGGGFIHLKEVLSPGEDYIKEGYMLILYFTPYLYEDQEEEGNVIIQFRSSWNNDIGDEATKYPRIRDKEYVKYLTFKKEMNGIKIDGENGLQTQNIAVSITSDVTNGGHIYVSKLAIVSPTSQATQ